MVKRYGWVTDPHFNYVDLPRLLSFFEDKDLDGIFLTGDISTGLMVASHLKIYESVLKKPIYFVLGNHDYYNSDFSTVKKSIAQITDKISNLKYLSVSDPIGLTDTVGVIGHDGWYDNSWIDPLTWLVFSYDWYFIKDFRELKSNARRLDKIKNLANEAAEFIGKTLEKALETYSTVYLLSHFPPWPNNKPSWKNVVNRFWNPYNSSKIMAETIERVMGRHPDKKLIVLAGHTHIDREVQITDNIMLRVGKAKCGSPEIRDIIIINE